MRTAQHRARRRLYLRAVQQHPAHILELHPRLINPPTTSGCLPRSGRYRQSRELGRFLVCDVPAVSADSRRDRTPVGSWVPGCQVQAMFTTATWPVARTRRAAWSTDDAVGPPAAGYLRSVSSSGLT